MCIRDRLIFSTLSGKVVYSDKAYTKHLDGRLKSAARRDVVRPAFKPGSRFVREYHGISHVVEVRDDRLFVWNEQSFKSLSHTARAITGYNVSGFQFFGVKL